MPKTFPSATPLQVHPSPRELIQPHYIFDIFHINRRPVLHVVDKSRRYQAARWLNKATAGKIWRSLHACWLDSHLRPPDLITHDAGKTIIARAFQANVKMLHIETKFVQIKAPKSMSFVERYSSPVRRAFNIIKHVAKDVNDDDALQKAVNSISDSVGPNGLIFTLLVHSALPRLMLPMYQPADSTIKRPTALRKATEDVYKYFARHHMSF